MAEPTDAGARLRAAVPAHVLAVCTRLVEAGHQAVTVGGAVRDAILGVTPGDWDVATSARPEEVMALFPRAIPTGLQHGTVTVVTDRGGAKSSHVEVTTFRGEGAYTDARRPDHVRFGVPLVEDLARRDLRVNAMAYDPAAGTIIDPYEGQRDLAERRLRAVGPTGDVYTDAVARFTEDGLRVMRAVRFAAVLEIDLDPDTVRGIVPALPSLAKVSRERVADELRKTLATRQPSRALRVAESTGIIAQIAPALAAGLDAWAGVRDSRAAAVEHWLTRVDAARDVRLAAMFTELATPDAALTRIDRAAVKASEAVLRALKFANDEIARASTLIGVASAPLAARTAQDDVWVRRLLADVTRAHASAAAALWRADGAAGLADAADAILARGDALSVGELVLGGSDLMRELALPPGPAIGKLLAQLLTEVLADPTLNARDRLLERSRAIQK